MTSRFPEHLSNLSHIAHSVSLLWICVILNFHCYTHPFPFTIQTLLEFSILGNFIWPHNKHVGFFQLASSDPLFWRSFVVVLLYLFLTFSSFNCMRNSHLTSIIKLKKVKLTSDIANGLLPLLQGRLGEQKRLLCDLVWANSKNKRRVGHLPKRKEI